MNYDQVARELVRALRGRRSQTALSRRLGYRTNVIYRWESGRDFPTAAKFLGLASRTGHDVRAAVEQFYRLTPNWLLEHPTHSPEAAAAFLRDLRGGTSVVELAAATGCSRFKVARWLKGDSEPRLPEFLLLLETCSLRLLDFVATLVDPASLPSLAEPWRDLEVTRRAAHEVPWTQAVLRCLELDDYRRLPAHAEGWVAERIGITRDEEETSLALLAESGQIRLDAGRWKVQHVLAVDTRRDRESTRALRAFWGRTAQSRMEQGEAQVASYNVFGVSTDDLMRIRDLHARFFRQMRAIVAQSEPVEHVVLSNFQLVPLGGLRSAPSGSGSKKKAAGRPMRSTGGEGGENPVA